MPEAAEHGLSVAPEASFPTRLWGYERRAVDAYVERTREAVAEALHARTVDGAVRAALERVGDETSAVLQQAHQIAEEITARAQAEAQELTARAQAEAHELTARSQSEAQGRLQGAEREAAAIRQAAEERVAALDAEIDTLWQERARTLEDMERISADLHMVVAAADARLPGADTASEDRERPGVETAGDDGVTGSDGAETLVHETSPPGARAVSPPTV